MIPLKQTMEITKICLRGIFMASPDTPEFRTFDPVIAVNILIAIFIATAFTMAATLLGIRTPNTFFALFLFSDKINYNDHNQCNQYSCNNKIFHNQTPKAYSAFIFLFVALIRARITNTNARRATKPLTAADIFREEGSVISVPIV